MCKKEFSQKLIHFFSSNLVLETFKGKQNKLRENKRKAEGVRASQCVKSSLDTA